MKKTFHAAKVKQNAISVVFISLERTIIAFGTFMVLRQIVWVMPLRFFKKKKPLRLLCDFSASFAVNLFFHISTLPIPFGEEPHLLLDKKFSSKKPVKVILTFLEEIEHTSEKRLIFSDFSFSQSQKELENYTGSFSDALIKERRSEL